MASPLRELRFVCSILRTGNGRSIGPIRKPQEHCNRLSSESFTVTMASSSGKMNSMVGKYCVAFAGRGSPTGPMGTGVLDGCGKDLGNQLDHVIYAGAKELTITSGSKFPQLRRIHMPADLIRIPWSVLKTGSKTARSLCELSGEQPTRSFRQRVLVIWTIYFLRVAECDVCRT
jgi:hypothetical protein